MKSSLFSFSLFVCFLNIVEGKVGENCFLDALEMNYSETGGRQKWHYKGDIFDNKVHGGNNNLFCLKQSKNFEKNVNVPLPHTPSSLGLKWNVIFFISKYH